jgi:hypothetical protein
VERLPLQLLEVAGVGCEASTGGRSNTLDAATTGSGLAGGDEDSVAEAIDPHIEALRKGCNGLIALPKVACASVAPRFYTHEVARAGFRDCTQFD